MSDEKLVQAFMEADHGMRAAKKRVNELLERQRTQIESLQREIAALRDVLDRRGNLSKYVDSGNLLVEQKAAAITPEMRGRIIKMAEIDDAEWDNFLVENGYPPSVKPAVTQLISDLRDFLGEQG